MLTVRADTTFDDGTYGIRIFLCTGLKPVSTKTPAENLAVSLAGKISNKYYR